MELHFLKIRWGDIIILKSGDRVAMIDTGYEGNFEQIREYLNALGTRKIDFILLSHFHPDHYGSIAQIVENFEVGTVYLKEYSGLDYKTAGGKLADDDYRRSEEEKYRSIKRAVETHSRLGVTERTEEIEFDGYRLKLYHAQNLIRQIYEDETHLEFYHRIAFSENQNSLAALMKVNGVNVFFGGDVRDEAWDHPLANRANTQIAQAIGEQIDIYKVPHHGTTRCNTDEALATYRPRMAVITNGKAFVEERSTILQDLARANADVRVLLTEERDVVIEISDTGEITVKD